MLQKSLGIIGTGNMAAALVSGWKKNRTIKTIVGFDVDSKKLAGFSKKYRIQKAESLRDLSRCQIILLAVKPQQMKEVCDSIKSLLSQKTLILSIAAGLDIHFFEKNLGLRPIIRLMPNTPALLGLGATGYYANKKCSRSDRIIAKTLFDAVGIVEEVKNEKLLDAVTALSGSGPAFFYRYVADMIAAATKLGLSSKASNQLAIQTAMGAASMLKDTGMDPETLVAQVTSKGGTTLAGLEVLNKKGFTKIVSACLKAAASRAAILRKNQ